VVDADLVDVLLCLDDVVRVPLDEDDRDRPFFWATTVKWQKKHDGRECDSNAPEHKQPPVVLGLSRRQAP
jgi:hypothetical protein